MKRWFRPLAYSVILALGLLAIFGGKAPADTSAPDRGSPRRTAVAPAHGQPLPTLHQRDQAVFPAALFAVDPAPPLPPPQPPEPAPPPAPAEVKVLGWMMSESVPYVFVEWNDASYTLKREESVGDVYRFDDIGGGFADFTYLPTGEGRRYAVRDPALLE